LTVGLLFGLAGSLKTFNNQSLALRETNDKNKLVAKVLEHHKVNYLVGDYWRTVPTKQASGNTQNILPLQNCSAPRTSLSSTQGANLHKQTFAYLLSFQKGLTDYPACTVKQVVDAYGRPNSSQLISGSLGNPKEQLLFYDRGINKPKDTSGLPAEPQTVVPTSLSDLVHTTCEGPTIMNIVAHEDDDLLFMNPDLIHDIKDGHCVRSVYLTAGDSGHDQFYWQDREKGSQAAYTAMAGSDSLWVQRIVKLSDHAFATVTNPRGNTKISTIYLHLPDGGLRGEGFPSSKRETLAQLDNGTLKTIHSVDKQSTYTQQELISSLSAIMHLYQPASIRTQADYQNGSYPDHPDHIAAGSLAQKAYNLYEQQQFEGGVKIPILYYAGYPGHGLAANIGADDMAAKEAAFNAYIKFDNGACRSIQACLVDQAYGAYLTRQYSFESFRN
jgi:LmbE family N-acetylglucosaminyl deacetylase